MRRLSTASFVLSFALLGLAEQGCKSRTQLDDQDDKKSNGELGSGGAGSEGSDAAMELERLRLANQETLHTIQIESLANDKRILEITNELMRLSLQLSNQDLSETERSNLTSKQAELQAESSKIQTVQKALKERIAVIKPKIADLDRRIIALAEELEAEGPEAADRFLPKIEALAKEIAELKRTSVGGAAEPAPSGPGTSSTELPKGILSTMTYQFYYEEPGVKKDCIDLSAGSSAEGAIAVAFPCSNSRKSQTFKLENFPDQSFRMIAQHSNQCLYVVDAAKTANSLVEQRSCTDPKQTAAAMTFKFREIDTDTGDFKIQNANSGLCLKISSDGRIVQAECNINFTLFQTSIVTVP